MQISDNECWEWKGNTNGKGYGVISIKGTRTYVHRVSFQLFKGKIPAWLQIDHLCRNKKCFNPNHLDLVTTQENTRRFHAHHSQNKKTCKNGHAITPENTILLSSRRLRRCLVCTKASWKRNNQQKKAKKLLLSRSET